MSMKAIREIIVTREEIGMIKNFLEVCEKFDIYDYDDKFEFLMTIVEEEEDFRGIDIVIKG